MNTLFMKRLLQFLIHFDHWAVLAITFLLMGLLWLAIAAIGVKNPFVQEVSNTSFSDTYYNFVADDINNLDENAEIIILDIGKVKSRSTIARMIAMVDSLHPKAIGVDLIFDSHGEDPEGDRSIKQVLQTASSHVVLAKAYDHGREESLRSYFADSLRLVQGNVNLSESGNVSIFYAINEENDTSFAAKLNVLWGGGNEELRRGWPIPIDFMQRFSVISIDSLADYADIIKDGIVLVGDASSFLDKHKTPIGPRSGVEIHAYCLKTLHDMDHYPRQIHWLMNFFIMLVMCYLLELALSAIHLSLSRKKKTWSAFLFEWIECSFLTNVVLWPFIFVLSIWMTDAVIYEWRYYQVTLFFTSLALTVESRNIYKSLVKALRLKHKWLFLDKSLIAK